MSPTRRDFLDTSFGAASALLLAGLPRPEPRRSAKPLKILILGGTGFIGPHMVRHGIAQGHEISMFNRGKTNPSLFPGVEHLTGDRDRGLDSLKGRKWDAVIDNSGYVPRHVRDSAELLRDNVGRYLFISTGSVYQWAGEEINEDSPLVVLEDPKSEDVEKHYGPLKVDCEKAVNEIYGPRATVVRLHIVAGPGDTTDRFTYWPVRFAQGGELIAPGEQSNPVQFVDVRDVAEFTVHLVEQNTGGTFNAAGPAEKDYSMATFLETVKGATKSSASYTWVDEKFLGERKANFPLWISQRGPARALCRVRSSRGIAAGLRFRPVATTARETLEWFKAEPADRQAKLNLQLDRDAKVLAEWKARG